MSNPELITAVDLDQWSGTLAAQTTLPILVRRLILATTPVSEITMRAREGALLPGWDGIIRSDAKDPHVPLGTSGWELGTSNDPRGKAQSDFRTRTKDPLGLDPKTTTFVAVTSLRRRPRLLGRPWAAREHKVLIKDLLRQPMPHSTRGSMSRMHVVELVFAIGWAAFWIYWLVAAFSMKRGRVPWSRELRIRAVVVVLAILLLRLGAFRDGRLNSEPWRAGLGLFLFAVGLGFAIWARLHIGRNWGTPMSQKDDPELVTSGPYRLVRHPIYSGILLAGADTAVALSWMWLIAMVLAGIYFVYSATVEERHLTKQFPGTYPTYRRSTKMLVPFIF